MIKADSISIVFDKKEILKELSFTVKEGERWVILGKNGSGKSSLLKLINALIKPADGALFVQDKPVSTLSPRELASLVAMVPQSINSNIPYSVERFLEMSTYAQSSEWSQKSIKQSSQFSKIITLCDIAHLLQQQIKTLSGGELQRTLLAGALLQDTPILLLDEPTSSLDPTHKSRFFSILNSINKQQKKTILMVTHEINSALEWGTHLLGLTKEKSYIKSLEETSKSNLKEVITSIYNSKIESYFNSYGNEIFTVRGGL